MLWADFIFCSFEPETPIAKASFPNSLRSADALILCSPVNFSELPQRQQLVIGNRCKYMTWMLLAINDLHQPPRRDARTKKRAAICGRSDECFCRHLFVDGFELSRIKIWPCLLPLFETSIQNIPNYRDMPVRTNLPCLLTVPLLFFIKYKW